MLGGGGGGGVLPASPCYFSKFRFSEVKFPPSEVEARIVQWQSLGFENPWNRPCLVYILMRIIILREEILFERAKLSLLYLRMIMVS